jgi:hypothetical protein
VRVDTALICDYVTVREGLFHILGGGITRLNRPAYPSQLGICLAVRIMVHPTEAPFPHKLQLLFADADAHEVAKMELGFQATSAPPVGLQPGEELAVMLPVQALGWPLPHPGDYRFDLLIDGIHQVSVPFVANPPTGTLLPPIATGG